MPLKGSAGAQPGADGSRGEDGDAGGEGGTVTISAHCITGGLLKVFANGGHGGVRWL